MVVLCGPESTETLDARRKLPTTGRRDARRPFVSDCQLLVIVRKNERRILLFERRPFRIVRGEREVDKLGVGNHVRVEVDLEALRVVADAMVGRIDGPTARIADTRSPDSFDDPEPGVRRPESTHAKRGGREV